MREEEKSGTPVLPESNSIVGKTWIIVLQYGAHKRVPYLAVYTVTVVTVSSALLAGWEDHFMCKDILAGLQEDVNR